MVYPLLVQAKNIFTILMRFGQDATPVSFFFTIFPKIEISAEEMRKISLTPQKEPRI